MRYLVTGAAGFIGSHITERLINEGKRVIAIDDLSTGHWKNLRFVMPTLHLMTVTNSILNNRQIDRYFEGIDCVFHLAGRADIIPSIEKPVEYFKVNVQGTLNILELCRKYKVKKLIYAASSSCYGKGPFIDKIGEGHALDPQHPYALTKMIGEQLVLQWGNLYNMDVVSLRLFNVYGLRSRTTGAYGAVIGTFLKQKLEGKPLTIVGDGNQTRDFIHVSDVVNAFIKASKVDIKEVNKIGYGNPRVINIGSGISHSINELAELIGGKVTHIPKRPGEPDNIVASNYRALNLLKWGSSVTFPTGIKELLAHIEDYRSASLWTPKSIKEATKEWFKHLK